MRKSEILQKDHEDLLLLYKRMKPEERLINEGSTVHNRVLLSEEFTLPQLS